jgi:hypothetical protein
VCTRKPHQPHTALISSDVDLRLRFTTLGK